MNHLHSEPCDFKRLDLPSLVCTHQSFSPLKCPSAHAWLAQPGGDLGVGGGLEGRNGGGGARSSSAACVPTRPQTWVMCGAKLEQHQDSGADLCFGLADIRGPIWRRCQTKVLVPLPLSHPLPTSISRTAWGSLTAPPSSSKPASNMELWKPTTAPISFLLQLCSVPSQPCSPEH